MRYAMLIIPALILALALAACQEEEEGPFGGDQEIAFQTLGSGQQSGIDLETPQLFVIRSQGEWEEFWGRHSTIAVPRPTPPAVDFDQQMVIAVVDQRQPSGGYSLEITRIVQAGDRLQVYATRRAPGSGCATTAVLTQPYHWVLLPPSDLEAELILTTQTYDC